MAGLNFSALCFGSGSRRPNASPLRLPLLVVLVLFAAGVLGCSGDAGSSAAKNQAAREELQQIPPPSRSRYLKVGDEDAYQNPFLLVEASTVRIVFIYPDQDPTAFGTGTFLRPANARRQRVEVRLSDLASALSALPTEVWPYGRVVAVQESTAVPKAERGAVHDNFQAAIRILNSLGVAVDEWASPDGSLLH